MPSSNDRDVVKPLPSFLVKRCRQDVTNAERDAAAHRTNASLRPVSVRDLVFCTGRILHSSFIHHSGRDGSRPLCGKGAVIDPYSSVVGQGHPGNYGRRESVFRNVGGVKVLIIESHAYGVSRVRAPVSPDETGVLIDVASEIACKRSHEGACLSEALSFIGIRNGSQRCVESVKHRSGGDNQRLASNLTAEVAEHEEAIFDDRSTE